MSGFPTGQLRYASTCMLRDFLTYHSNPYPECTIHPWLNTLKAYNIFMFYELVEWAVISKSSAFLIEDLRKILNLLIILWSTFILDMISV